MLQRYTFALVCVLALLIAHPAIVAATESPYLGSPVTLPGRVEAENFDNGYDGESYHDTTAGNAGGVYRQTNADIQACSEGGYNLGWVAAGEWMNYSVNVVSAGSYTVRLRVASTGGGSLHVGFNGPSNVWKSVSIPATGGWQNWTTVSLPVTLGAGRQLLTLVYDTGGYNLNYIDVVAGTASTTSTSSSSSGLTVATWNLKVSSDWSHAAQAMDDLMTLSPRPKVIIVEEAWASLYSSYINELQSRTGRTWQGVFRGHCKTGGWNGSYCTSNEQEGVAIFTSLPVVATSSTLLPYPDSWHSARALVRMTVNYNGINVTLLGTHMPQNTTSRYQAMSALKSYASNYSAPKIVGGDFNADMDQIDTSSGMYPNFTDTWKQKGSGHGYTATTPYPTMKLDYLFVDSSGRASTDWTVVLQNFWTFSDHFAVYNSFTVR